MKPNNMNLNRIAHRSRQRGATLIEVMVGLALSLIVTTAMVVLMGNSMGSASRIIEMSQLTDELRNTMSMLSRDARRANYSPFSMFCYGKPDCGLAGNAYFIADMVTLDQDANGTDDCLVYFLDRTGPEDPDRVNANSPDVAGGGFRLTAADGIGMVEVWTGNGAPPNDCTGNEWLAITDPNLVDVTDFVVDDNAIAEAGEIPSFSNTITQDDGSTLTQRVRLVRVDIEGELLLDRTISRRIEDFIRVRNDHVQFTPST
jgi:Tfp pilus assembly protein PilW